MTVAACMALVRKRHSSLELKYEELARHKNGRKSLSMGGQDLGTRGADKGGCDSKGDVGKNKSFWATLKKQDLFQGQ